MITSLLYALPTQNTLILSVTVLSKSKQNGLILKTDDLCMKMEVMRKPTWNLCPQNAYAEILCILHKTLQILQFCFSSITELSFENIFLLFCIT